MTARTSPDQESSGRLRAGRWSLLGAVGTNVPGRSAGRPCATPVAAARLEVEQEVVTVEVVVGVAGGDRSDAAVAWGAQEAARCGVALVLVHAYAVPAVPSVGGPLRTPEMHLQVETAARRVLARARRLAQGAEPGVEVRTDAIRGVAGEVLPARAEQARALVLGGHHSHVGRHLGRTASACLRHGTCPVVLVPAEARSSEPAAAGTP